MHTHNDFLEAPAGSVWRDRLLTTGAAIIIGLTLSNTSPAADEVTRDTKRTADTKHDQTVRHAQAEYKAARARCNQLAGNEKDVCLKQAKAKQTRAKADAKALKKTTAAKAEANEEKRDAQFKVAKEKCDAMNGNAKDACQKQAESKYRH